MPTRIGDLLSVETGVILQQVNAQGVMGSGIAKAIRAKYPMVWDDYRSVVKHGLSARESSELLGQVIWSEVGQDLLVANIIGQQFYRGPGQPELSRYTSYDALDIALTHIGEVLRPHPDLQVHYPLLGSDRGGAHWPTVKSIIEHRLQGIRHYLWLLPGTQEPQS